MKHWIRILFTACVLLFGSVPLEAAASQIDIPSAAESTIAPGRNFYVKGTYSLPAGYTASKVVVNMYRSGNYELVRRIQGNVPNPPLWVEGNPSVSFNSWGSVEDIMYSGMPELIWDGEDPDSFYQGYRKCYFDDLGFAALIPGGEGVVDDGLPLVDENGAPYPILASGDYRLEVSVTCQDGLGNRNYIKIYKWITIGVTENKLLSRFSPDTHMSRITEWARKKGYRIYNDPFAGAWWGSNFEIPAEMRASDMAEYSAGKAHFVIYNVSSGSTTYNVELARLQQQGVVNNSSRLVNYYYQYGEPVLKDASESEITAFETGDKLQLTRAEIGDQISGEAGIYDQDDTNIPDYDLDFSDGIRAKAGDRIAIYGVTAPIQISPSDIQEIGTGVDKNSFLLNNKISTLHYEISGDGISEQMDGDVALDRIMDGESHFSELEFKHVLEITEEMTAKDLLVTVTGYDAYGQIAAGTEERFEIHVAADGSGPSVSPTPSVSPDPVVSPITDSVKKPGKVKITSISSTPQTVTIKWNKICSADKYAVYCYNAKKNKWVEIAETKKGTYKNTGLSPAKEYRFRVRSIKQSASGRKEYGDYGNVMKILTRPEVPRKVKFRQIKNPASGTKTILTLNASRRADGYYIYQFQNGRYRLSYKIAGTKIYQCTAGRNGRVYKLAGTARIRNGKIRCTLPGAAQIQNSPGYFKIRSYAVKKGLQQQNSLYSKPKKLHF